MQIRSLGNTGLEVSILGLGMGQLQFKEAERVVPVVQRALEAGITYFDVLAGNPGVKDAFGAAFRGRREELVLAGHLGISEQDGQYCRTRDPRRCEMEFLDLLARLGTDHVDILHLHNVDEAADYEEMVAPGGVLDLARRLKQEGKARCIGLSGHMPAVALRAVESGQVDVLMHVVSVLMWGYQERQALLKRCAGKGVGVVGMKSFGGGAVFVERMPITPVQCLAYTLAQPGVSTALVGAQNVAELEAALALVAASEAERDFSGAVRFLQEAESPPASGQSGQAGFCVYCSHCLPCPMQLDVAAILRLLATAQHGPSARLRAEYQALAVPASACSACGACIERCPFGVDVIGGMRQAAALFES